MSEAERSDMVPGPEAREPEVPQSGPAPELVTLQQDAAAWRLRRLRQEGREDYLAADAIATWCVNGRPELSDRVKERLRHRLGEVSLMVERLRYIPSEGTARQRFDALKTDAQQQNQEVAVATRQSASRRRSEKGIRPASRQWRR